MQILSSYDPTTDRFQLHYDHEAQFAFDRAYAAVKTFSRMPSIQQKLGERCRMIQARLFIGKNLLRELAEKTERQVGVSALELPTCVEIALLVATYRIEIGKPAPSLSKAIILLAQVTPFGVPPLPLPPASEVFDKGTIPVSVLHTYETIRKAKKPEEQHIVLLDLYQLWHALDQVKPSNTQLRGLLHILDLLTEMFRRTMEVQAVAAVGVTHPKKKQERRKS